MLRGGGGGGVKSENVGMHRKLSRLDFQTEGDCDFQGVNPLPLKTAVIVTLQ